MNRIYKFTFNDEPRPCDICHKKYRPTSGNQKYCGSCAAKKRLTDAAKQRERAKRRREKESKDER